MVSDHNIYSLAKVFIFLVIGLSFAFGGYYFRPFIYFEIGNIYQSISQHDQAISYYSKVVKINPKFAGAFHNRGISYIMLDYRVLGKHDFERACNLGLCDESDLAKLEAKMGGRFIAYDNGVVRDTTTNLEWMTGPDRRTNWYEANSWIVILSADNKGWRMPTREELKTIYQKGFGRRNMPPFLKTTGWWVWSGETFGSPYPHTAWIFNFKDGYDVSYSCINEHTSYINLRCFAVRSLK